MYLFITLADLKEAVNINNVDVNQIAPFVEEAQDLHFQEIIGGRFYNYLYNTFSAGTQTTNEQMLMDDYIKKCIVYRSIAIALPELSDEITNKGIQKRNEDFSQPSSDGRVDYRIRRWEKKAETYERRLNDFLCLSGSLFSEYVASNNTVVPKNGDWSGGFGIVNLM